VVSVTGAMLLTHCGNDVVVVSPPGPGASDEPDGGIGGARKDCTGVEGWRVTPNPLPDIQLAAWTGDELMLWGIGTHVGYRYNSETETWRKMAPAPAMRMSPFGWVGAIAANRFFVWNYAGGAAYDWAADVWTSMAPMGGVPVNDTLNRTAVGTPTHLIYIDAPLFTPGQPARTLTGKIYDVARDAWESLPEQGAPAAVWAPVVVWTGRELLVWAGVTEVGPTNKGARFNPATMTWTPMSTVNAPERGAAGAAPVWTGKELFVWSNSWEDGYMGGGLYDPARNVWTEVTRDGAPQSAGLGAWTGHEVIVTALGNHRIYNPSDNSWRPMMQPPGRGMWSFVQWDGCRLLATNSYQFAIYQPAAR